MKRHRMIGILLALSMVIACSPVEDDESKHDKILYTSIYPIQFVVEQLAGNIADVISVYPPGVDAHTYEPTIKEIMEIAHGKAFIYLGVGMEGFSDEAAHALESSDIQFIELGTHPDLFIKEDDHSNHDHDHGDYDPHIWFDPLRMIQVSEIIKDELIYIFPNNQDIIEGNFNQLKDQLTQLDEEYVTTLQQKNNPQILVSHAAYGYWEERYNIKQIPISGLTSGNEPSQKELAHIVELAQQQNIQHVLFEQNSSNRLATIIQEHIGADALYIHNLEVLVDTDIESQEDYFSLMRSNLDILDQATQ